MNEQWIIGGVNLAVLAYLLWRVWRLEDTVRSNDRSVRDALESEAVYRTNGDAQRVAWSEHALLHTSLKSLAHALGYEWKSTPAKSGWERKASPFGFKPLTGEAREEAIRSIEHAINNTPNQFASCRIRYCESGDRRKGDRRKPTTAKPASDPFPSPLDRVDKPARTAAKRGPKRATH